MSAIRYKDKVYGGSAIVDNASHLIADNGSGTNVTGQQLLENILGNFATVEASTTASKAYAVGEYLIYNSFLYRVTTAIASGGTINTGTGGNVKQTTVGEEEANRELWWGGTDAKTVYAQSTTGTIVQIDDPLITANHVLTKFVAENPSYITSGISCTTTEGQAIITGTCSAQTTAEIMLTRKSN